jgi:3-dehydroquinate dehydratase-2
MGENNKNSARKPSDRSVILIGLPGVGKTTVGRLVADRLGRPFIDSDAEIERREGAFCAEILNQRGEDAFRDVERAVVAELSERRGIVLAVGGGAPMTCADLLSRHSVVAYLQRNIEEIARTLDASSRPLSRSIDDLRRLHDARAATYERLADVRVADEDAIAAAAAIGDFARRCLKARLLILNGPNLNMLGTREPEIYGSRTYGDLLAEITRAADERGIAADTLQSNHEGQLIDLIQSALHKYDGIVVNPGAYTHYSYAIHDALKAVAHAVPAVETHLSDIAAREEWRRVSVTEPACVAQISGRGFAGYADAMDFLLDLAESKF